MDGSAPSDAPAPTIAGAAARVARGAETLAGWGRLARPGSELRSEDLAAITKDVPLTRGLGRSYGDSSLPAPGDRVLAASPLADRILSFDPSSGRLRAEAGLSLVALNRVMLPRGFFPPVTPGTQYVTLGGMVASDVHGKNHHVAGCFGEHVHAILVRLADGSIVECGPDRDPDLFWATVGGMGLLGHILEVEFTLDRIPTPWIWQESEKVANIDDFIATLGRSAETWPMTMGWIDCLARGKALGRGILQRGRWATPAEAPSGVPRPKRRVAMPFVLPQVVLSRLSILAFNALYYRKQWRRIVPGIIHPESFFYPLDMIRHWNRMYGPRGFTQYQCVVPPEHARPFLELLSRRGGASFLCVIKDCGPEGRGVLSFPKRGISIALDIAVRPNTQTLVDSLNEYVIAVGGRMYLTKDAFTRSDHFAAMEPRLPRFLELKRRYDPHGRLRSAQSVRILGVP